MSPKKVFFYMSGNLHNAYKQMLANPPDGFEYTSSEGMAFKSQPIENPSLKSSLIKRVAPSISPFYNKAHIHLNKPKSRTLRIEGYDLVHSGQSLLDTPLPYVVDFEHAGAFSGFNQFAFQKEGFKKALRKKLLEKNLKKLIAWSNAAKMSLLNPLQDKAIEEKTEIVYAPITPPPKFERTKHSGINFLFVGKLFFEKGGYDVLLAFDKISSKYDAKLTIISPVPEEIQLKFSGNSKIRFLSNVSFGTLRQLYLETDVLVFPSHYDTFGYVIAEAFSYGIPVISVDSFATPELIEDGKTGLLVKSFFSSYNPDFSYKWGTPEELSRMRLEACKHPTQDYLDSLSEKMILLIENDSLRGSLSKNARTEALEGKFSPKVWKENIGRTYEEALRK